MVKNGIFNELWKNAAKTTNLENQIYKFAKQYPYTEVEIISSTTGNFGEKKLGTYYEIMNHYKGRVFELFKSFEVSKNEALSFILDNINNNKEFFKYDSNIDMYRFLTGQNKY